MEQLTVASSDIQSGARSFAASSVISGAVGMSAHVISGRPIEVPPGIPAAAIVLVFFANGCIISRPSARMQKSTNRSSQPIDAASAGLVEFVELFGMTMCAINGPRVISTRRPAIGGAMSPVAAAAIAGPLHHTSPSRAKRLDVFYNMWRRRFRHCDDAFRACAQFGGGAGFDPRRSATTTDPARSVGPKRRRCVIGVQTEAKKKRPRADSRPMAA